MKVVIASDIHGTVEYLQKLIFIIKEANIDKVILLGDYFNYLEDDNKNLINLLNSLKDKLIAIKGNCDSPYNIENLSFKLHNYYLLEIDNLKLFLTHIKEEYEYLIADDYIPVCGHTHIYNLKNNYINPGSLGKPRIHKEHTYIIYENNKFTLYDIDKKEKIKELVIEGK